MNQQAISSISSIQIKSCYPISSHFRLFITLIYLKINQELKNKRKKVKLDIIPKIESILELYTSIGDRKRKNILLKTIVDHCIYNKEKHKKNDEFSLVIHPKIQKKYPHFKRV